MSSEHKAICKCGFTKILTVGGMMGSFREDSRFPFYCQHCGLVEANIAKFIGNNHAETSSINQNEIPSAPTCPHCGNAHIDQYGKPPASFASKKQARTLQAWRFDANKEGNLCPVCKEMTLVFHHAHREID
jgi:hypothetical protein